MGEQQPTGMAALPTRPKERGPDDDGSFKRRSDYNDNRRDQEFSRSDGDNNWRRGGSSSADSSLRGGAYDDRRGGGGYNRRGGGGYERHDNYQDRDVGGYDRRGGYNDNRNSFDNFDRRGGNRGGYENFNDRSGSGFDSFRRGGNDRGAPAGDGKSLSSSQTGMRPRLQLKTRTAPLPEPPKAEAKVEIRSNDEEIEKSTNPVEANEQGTKPPVSSNTEEKVAANSSPPLSGNDGWETVEGVKNNSSKEIQTRKSAEENDSKEDGEKAKKLEPAAVNSRAAMLESAPDVKRDSTNWKDNERSRGPPPVVNKRFGELADEERGMQKNRDSRRGPPPIVNSRFSAAAEADLEFRSAANSRFEGGSEANRDYTNNRGNLYDNRSRGPPPVANSRFAAAAEADRDRSYNRKDSDRGPPPIANSRFAAAAEADRDLNYNREKNSERMDDRNLGPPPIANSRFAAAAEADRDLNYNREKNSERMDDRNLGPPPVANSRFAAAAAADRDYNRDDDDFDGGQGSRGSSSRFAEADMGRSYNRDGNSANVDNRFRGPPPVANSRFAAAAQADRDYSHDHDGYNAAVGDRHSYNNDDRRGYDDGRGDRFNESSRYHQQEKQPQKSSVADLLKPKARLMEENILKMPTKDQSENFLSPPSKQREENADKPPSKSKPVPETEASEKTRAAPLEVDYGAILAEFVSGQKLGNDLKTWFEGLSCIPPSVEKLVFTLLTEKEKSAPDLECAWAEPNNYGTLLLSLVEDDLLKQMEVLFAIQKYCDTIGFPKLDDEYVVQAMFRSMYKYDLADDETFALWKEDESPEHEVGKLKAVIQTVDWFNWLEEDEEEDDDEDEE